MAFLNIGPVTPDRTVGLRLVCEGRLSQGENGAPLWVYDVDYRRWIRLSDGSIRDLSGDAIDIITTEEKLTLKGIIDKYVGVSDANLQKA